MADAPLVHFERARAELAQATSIDEVKGIRDKAAALRSYVQQQGASLEMQNQCAEIKLRAERRAGELLAADERIARGGSKFRDGTLKECSVTKKQSHRWQRIAALPEPEFEKHIDAEKAAKHELTSSGMLAKAKAWLNGKKNVDVDEQTPAKVTTQLDDLIAADRKFGTIYADPPWKYGNQATRAATDNHYPTLTVDEIAALPVAELAADTGHLHLWTTNAFLPAAFDVIEAWGFAYKSCFVWVKTQLGIGNYWRVSHEFLLLGVRGSCPFQDHSLASWLELPRTQHSAKPEDVRGLIERASPSPRLEMFARTTARGWTAWGNQIQEQLFDGRQEDAANSTASIPRGE